MAGDDDTLTHLIFDRVSSQTRRVNLFMLFNAILMGVVVGVGAYSPRSRSHPVISLLFLGANTLFLPIISDVAATVSSDQYFLRSFQKVSLFEGCNQDLHILLVFLWTELVLLIGINTSVVARDAREYRSVPPPIELLIKTIWTAYIAFSTIASPYLVIAQGNREDAKTIFPQLFVIIFAKLLCMYLVFCKAQRSFEFDESPPIIARYIANHLADDQVHWAPAWDDEVRPPAWDDEVRPPALIVMGEDNVRVDAEPHGYRAVEEWRDRLVTLDRIWRWNDMQPWSIESQTRDLCFSFALFKLLRCRFAKYTAAEAGFMTAHKFFRRAYIQGDDYEKAFQVITDELSFINDYYYSSLPIFYSHYLIPALSTSLSLWSIGYCLYLTGFVTSAVTSHYGGQVFCEYNSKEESHPKEYGSTFEYGNKYFDAIPVYFVLVVLMLAEARSIAFYICSNWTKVALVCHYLDRRFWQRYHPALQKCIVFVFKYCRCKMLNHSWEDKMTLCSVVVLRPWKNPLRLCSLLGWWRKKRVKVPSAVKAAVFRALNAQHLTGDQQIRPPRAYTVLQQIRPPSPPTSSSDHTDIGGASASERGRKRAAYTILVWHIATSIFELNNKQPPPASNDDPEYHHMIAATHISCYCAYLVAYFPEVLPNDAEWCKQLYRDARKDADRVLGAGAERRQVVDLITADSRNEVLKNGARLGQRLVDSDMKWEALAQFWADMILYVAPSENLEAHAEAIGHGGELITLLWALLAHAGIVGRVDADDAHFVAYADDAHFVA